MSNTLKYHELYTKGMDGERYKIKSHNPSFNGKVVVLKRTPSGAIVVKHDGTYGTDNGDDILRPYGHIVSAEYTLVANYKAITLQEAVQLMERDSSMYVKRDGEMVYVNDVKDFSAFGVEDFYDLVRCEFYVKA